MSKIAIIAHDISEEAKTGNLKFGDKSRLRHTKKFNF
jgi:hypothetical protein